MTNQSGHIVAAAAPYRMRTCLEYAMRSWILAMLVVLHPAFAMAQSGTAAPVTDSGLETLKTANDTRGWEAVGRIDIADRAFCTGALIAPDLVLTAAHCLFDKDTGQQFGAQDFKFLAGWRDGRAVAYRGVKRAMPHPSYEYLGPENIEGVPYDLAILQLDQPIRLANVAPYEIGDDPAMGDQVEVVSYAFDRSEAPSLQSACHVIGPQPGMVVFTCSVDFGSSGAPIFKVENGVPKIVAVVSAKAEMDGQPVSLSAAMNEPLAELRDAFDGPGTAMPTSVQATGRLPQIGGKSSGGAKFVTP